MGKKEKQCRTYPDARLFIDEPLKGFVENVLANEVYFCFILIIYGGLCLLVLL